MSYRIAFISEHASPLAALGGVDAGGQNVYVGQLARELAALGYEVDIFTRRDNVRLPVVVQWMKGVRVIHVHAGPAEFVPKEKLLDLMPDFRDYMLAFIKSNRLQYQLVHANFFMSAWVAHQLRNTLQTPYVVTFHALGQVRRLHQGDADQFPARRLDIEAEIAREADHIIAECPQDREDLLKYYNAAPARITMIPCGFDPAEFYPVDRQLARMLVGLDPEAAVILQLGRMVPRKGVDNVIQAMGLLKNKIRHLHLVIVGGASGHPENDTDPEIQRLRRIAADLGLTARITFAGQQPRAQLKYYYAAADVFLTTPWYEPFGITPLEAMACGTPVIGARVGGIKFSVADGKTGFLVAPKDPHALAEKIETLVQDPALRAQMGRHARDRVNALFTWAGVARKMLAVYERVILAKHAQATPAGYLQMIDDAFDSAVRILKKAGPALRMQVLMAGQRMVECLRRGNKIMICGNAGSVAASQHFAAQLASRYTPPEQRPLAAMALAADPQLVPAGDLENTFSRQIAAHGKAGDLLICLSATGNDRAVIQALMTARQQGIHCIGQLGKDGGKALQYTDIDITVPSPQVHRIKELHMNIVHTLTEIVEHALCTPQHIEPEQTLGDLNVAV
ncbi:MAG TPA: glycosyltransferase [Chitinophaga sp.]